MIERIEKNGKNQFEELERHFISENARKLTLYCTKKSSKEVKEEAQKFLNDKVRQRENLYIYPEEVNV